MGCSEAAERYWAHAHRAWIVAGGTVGGDIDCWDAVDAAVCGVGTSGSPPLRGLLVVAGIGVAVTDGMRIAGEEEDVVAAAVAESGCPAEEGDFWGSNRRERSDKYKKQF